MKLRHILLVAVSLLPAQAYARGGNSGMSSGGGGLSDVFLPDSVRGPTGPMSPTSLYAGMVGNATIGNPGVYAPEDLPVTLTFPPNSLGEAAAASVTAYTAVSARVVSRGKNCAARSVFTVANTDTKITVSDGNGRFGSEVKVSSGGSGPANVIPANPVTPTSDRSSCRPPTFNLSWGVSAISLVNQGWGYTSAPTATGGTSTAADAEVASVTTVLGDAPFNLSEKLIPTSRIGAANGVAALDSSGHVTAPISSSDLVSQHTYIRDIQPKSEFPSRNYKATFFDNLQDPSTNPDTILFGGHQKYDDAFMKITAQTYSRGDLGGAVLSVTDSDQPTFNIRNGAGLDDAITMFLQSKDTAPRVEAGPEITDPVDNMRHTVTFSGTGLTITPALPEVEVARIRKKMRLYTNWKSGNATDSGGISGIAMSRHHIFVKPNVYYAYVADVKNTGSATAITVYRDPDRQEIGWRNEVSSSTDYPGHSSGDSIDTTTDTASSAPGLIWPYRKPSVFIGLANKKFIANPMSQMTAPTDTLTRAQAGYEVDIGTPENFADYRRFISGFTIAPNTNGHRLSDDSYVMHLGGTGFPHMLEIAAGAEASNIVGSSFYAGTVGYGDNDTSPESVMAQGYAKLMADSTQYTSPNQSNQVVGGHPHSLVTYQQRMTDDTDGSHINANDVSINIQEEFGGGSPDYYGHGGLDGMMLGKVRFFNGDVYLCASQEGTVTADTVDAKACGVVVTNDGVHLNTDTLTGKGKAFIIAAPNGTRNNYIYSTNSSAVLNGSWTAAGGVTLNAGATVGVAQGVAFRPAGYTDGQQAPMLVGENQTTLRLVTNAGQPSSLNAYNVAAKGTLSATKQINNAVATFAKLTSSAVVGTQEFCSDCYSHSNPSKTRGIPVWWNGSRWGDALGQAVGH
ncbi:hypothetical protein [Acetobacter aceti]|uniref:Uncharacterized protein n=1 Tax=Acetobacter aceti TaxID=435 RepID=A0A6S6PMU5_ACEAC|nr:hypothetical protein [Acetobacter aceti]BCI66052.1 hypothetical protein AAJCM20276_06760 [Acetobacter aceti]